MTRKNSRAVPEFSALRTTAAAQFLNGSAGTGYAKPACMTAFQRILVSVDFGEPSIAALEYGIEAARTHGASLDVLHVVNSADATAAAARARLEALMADHDTDGLDVFPVVVASADVPDAILEFGVTRQIDLIVMGTHGGGSWMRFFVGSVAQQVVRSAPCPVMTVRPPLRDSLGMVATASMPDVCALHH